MASGIGRRVRQRRKELHYTLEELAAAAHMSRQSVQAIEVGTSKEPGVERTLRLADALRVDPYWLVTGVARGEAAGVAVPPEKMRDVAWILSLTEQARGFVRKALDAATESGLLARPIESSAEPDGNDHGELAEEE